MSQVYSDYAKARLGWLPFGLTGWQGAIVAASSLPVFWSLKEQAWSSAAMFLLICLAVTGLTVEDFQGTTISLTNPGTIGTVHSVPRLMPGQGAIIGAGAMEYPAEFQGASDEQIADAARRLAG